MAMNFIEAKSITDEAVELKQQMVKKSANAIVKYVASVMNAAGDKRKKPSDVKKDIDKLLDNFPAEDRYEIMKEAFIAMQ